MDFSKITSIEDEFGEEALQKAEESIFNKLVIDDKLIFDINNPIGKSMLEELIKEEAARMFKNMTLLKDIEAAIKEEPHLIDDILEVLFMITPRKVLIEKSR